MSSIHVVIFLHCQVILLTALLAEGHTSEEVRLTKRLLKDYVRSARPVRRDIVPINLTIDIAFNQLLDMDEQQQVMTAVTWLRVGWVDEYLKWNSSEQGVELISLSHHDCWVPDLTLLNTATDMAVILPNTRLIVNSSGYVTWLQPTITKSQCTLFSLYFPFDVQKCPLDFGSWVYSSIEVDLLAKNPTGDGSEFVPNGAWKLIDIPMERKSRMYQCCPHSFTTITYVVVLRRLSLYFVFHLFLPCVLFSFVSLMVFYLPCDSGEKTSLAVTMLLALTVFMLVASEYLPPSSSHIPIIAQYFMGTIVLLSLCLVATVITLHVHHRGDYGAPAPSWLNRLTLTYLARPLCLSEFSSRRRKTAYSAEIAGSETVKPEQRDTRTRELSTVSRLITPKVRAAKELRMLSESVSNHSSNGNHSSRKLSLKDHETPSDVDSGLLCEINRHFQEEDDHAENVEEWNMIAAVLDRAFLILFTVAALALNGYTYARYVVES